jgi:hypothetical protein
MEYLSQIENVGDIDFAALLAKTKMEQPLLYLVELCSLLNEKAVSYYEDPKNRTWNRQQPKAFKIGHILINSNQVGEEEICVGLLRQKEGTRKCHLSFSKRWHLLTPFCVLRTRHRRGHSKSAMFSPIQTKEEMVHPDLTTSVLNPNPTCLSRFGSGSYLTFKNDRPIKLNKNVTKCFLKQNL